MTCRELAEFLLAYINGELSPAETSEFDRHMKVCPACVKYVDSYKKTIHLGKAAFSDETKIPTNVPEALVQAILKAREKG